MIYYITRFFLRVACKVLFRWEIYGLENIPRTGGALLAANHASFLDPLLLGIPLRRSVYLLARNTLFRPRPWGWYLKKIHAVPLDRGRFYPESLKRVLGLLGEGEIVVVFPEGTRGDGRTLGRAKGGLGLLVARSGVPVVPAYISGAARVLPKGACFLRLRKVRIIYGLPLNLAPRGDAPPAEGDFREIGSRVMAEIAELKKGVAEMFTEGDNDLSDNLIGNDTA